MDSHSEDVMGMEVAHIPPPIIIATLQTRSMLPTRQVGKLHLDVCPGRKGYGFGKELESFCHQDLQNDQEASLWPAREAVWGRGYLWSPHLHTAPL